MSDLPARREVRTYEHLVDAPPAKVFPLLCPVEEYKWIDIWSCEMVYSQSGVAENNCIFKTNFPHDGEAVWTVSRYEPPRAIEFVVVYPGSFVQKLDIAVTEEAAGSRLRWTRTYTGLSAAGNELVATLAGEAFDLMMKRLDAILNHYCRTGEMLVGWE